MIHHFQHTNISCCCSYPIISHQNHPKSPYWFLMLKSHINLSTIILWIWRYPSCSDTSISFLSLDRSQGSATWSTSWTAGSSSSKARSSSSCSRTQCRKRRLGTGKWAMLPDLAWIWLVVVRFYGVISNNLQEFSSSDGYEGWHHPLLSTSGAALLAPGPPGRRQPAGPGSFGGALRGAGALGVAAAGGAGRDAEDAPWERNGGVWTFYIGYLWYIYGISMVYLWKLYLWYIYGIYR